MKQIVQQQRSGRLSVTEVPAPALRPDGLLIRTAYSLISAGTERTKVQVARKNLLGKALARPDQVRQVIRTYRQLGLQSTYQKVATRLDALNPLGYSSAGVVVAVGKRLPGFSPGDRVACAGGGYASHAEVVYVPGNLCAPVPVEVGLEEAAFATLGAISLQGIRQAAPTLGETVGVIGLGLVGLLTVQLLKASGCRVIGLDTNPSRCKLAKKMGADAATAPDHPSLDGIVARFAPQGLDAVILTAATPSDEPIHLAGQLARDRGRVVVVGDVGMQIPRALYYEKEIDVRLSRSYGPGRYDPAYEEKGLEYPIGYVRWTEGRNLAAFLDLLGQGKLNVKMLISHRFAIADAEDAYDLIQSKSGDAYLGVLLDYGFPSGETMASVNSGPVPVRAEGKVSGSIGVALLGAGNYAQSMLLPHLRSHPGVSLRSVITPSGLTARSAAERFGFAVCASDADIALYDPDVDLVLIASRHDSHADLVIRALKAGKSVFVEKPLALNADELASIQEAYASSDSPFVMVGFNRRFAPLVVSLRDFLQPAPEPMLLHFRVNAGMISVDHWLQDPQVGGGRVIGEMCHFIDLMAHLVAHPPVEVYAQGLPDSGRYSRDNLTATVRFLDGSVGTITYAANGDPGLEKERLEVFSAGKAAVLEDFRRLTLASGERRKVRRSKPDKGHKQELQTLIEAVRTGAPAPVPFQEAVRTTAATFAIVDSLTRGLPISISAATLNHVEKSK